MKEFPIKVGAMLFTIVEPHRGHEVEYNRWYERDHFYSGCLIGTGNFAGKRWVATREEKARRYPDDNPITPSRDVGSYLATYWIQDGMLEEWNKWAYKQVHVLHQEGRMFAERDHVHTLMYVNALETRRDEDGLSLALALDHPCTGLVVTHVEADDRAAAIEWYQAKLPGLIAGTGVAVVGGFTPMPIEVDAPGVKRAGPDERRLALLWFLDGDPEATWNQLFANYADDSGAELLWCGPFRPTIPGTDTYTDQLW